MGVKYRIEYTSVNDIDYTCDISNPDYSGSVITLDGNVEYGMNSVDGLQHPIRSKYLRIRTTATLAQPLDDLLTNGDRYWRVEFYRDVDKIFFGYLSTEDTPQSFVTDSWELELNALDPMAYLQDLGYVDNTGATYQGYERLGAIIANCLKRGFADSSEEFNFLAYVNYDFRTRNVDLSYTNYTSGLFMRLAEMSQDGFVDTNSGEAQSCQEVLEKVLNSLQLTITQINGDTWLLQHWLFDQSGISSTYIDYYDSDYGSSVGTPEDPFNDVVLKTQSVLTTDSDVIHANANQQYYFKIPITKLVIDHQYDYKETLIENATLDGGTDGVSMPDWSSGGDYSNPTSSGYIEVFRYDSGLNTDPFAAESNTNLEVLGGQIFKVKIVCESNFDPSTTSGPFFRYNVRYETWSGTTYYLTTSAPITGQVLVWKSFGSEPLGRPVFIRDDEGNAVVDEELTFEQVLPELPGTSGTLDVVIYAAYPEDSSNVTDKILIHEVDLLPVSTEVTGTSRNMENTQDDGFKTIEEDIFIDTVQSSAIHNNIRHVSTERSITEVIDKSRAAELGGISAYYALGRHFGWNRLSHNRLKKVFTGDFYNFYEPHNVLTIPDLDANQYRVVEYSFDTQRNVGTHKLVQRMAVILNSFIEHDLDNIYADTIKPTIK